MTAPTPAETAQVKRMATQYFQLVELPHLSFPQSPSLMKPEVQQLIYESMFNEAACWPMPPVWYRSRVLKSLISRLEAAIIDPDEDEINDSLVAAWGELIALPRRPAHLEAQELSYIRYTAPTSLGSDAASSDSRPYIITCENRNLILAAGTTGFRTWEAALHLATYLSTAEGRRLVQGMAVIELGCGVGLLSMYCLKCLNARTVVATDMEQGLMDALDDGIKRNQLDSQRITGRLWNWADALGGEDNDAGEKLQFDVAIGADLIYDPDVVPLLVKAIGRLFTHHGVKHFVIAATLRNVATFELFLAQCAASGFTCSKVDYESPPRTEQDGLYHDTDNPIHTYIVKPHE
ncbi:hypothetical protein KEM52_003816 [Ascosphaera acerosa]|nr:hypothetical protein KEM52_003816 [Ascosphaera acerosa]